MIDIALKLKPDNAMRRIYLKFLFVDEEQRASLNKLVR
jgi:hypothetical protein